MSTLTNSVSKLLEDINLNTVSNNRLSYNLCKSKNPERDSVRKQRSQRLETSVMVVSVTVPS